MMPLNEEISHIQINNKDFRINNDPQLSLDNPEETLSEIDLLEELPG